MGGLGAAAGLLFTEPVVSIPAVEPGQYVERKMTGSIYAIRNIWKAPVGDREWFTYRIEVRGKPLRPYINDRLMADYPEPADLEAITPLCTLCQEVGASVGTGGSAKRGRTIHKNVRITGITENISRIGTIRELEQGRHLVHRQDLLGGLALEGDAEVDVSDVRGGLDDAGPVHADGADGLAVLMRAGDVRGSRRAAGRGTGMQSVL